MPQVSARSRRVTLFLETGDPAGRLCTLVQSAVMKETRVLCFRDVLQECQITLSMPRE